MKVVHVEPTTRCNLRCRQCRLRAPWWKGQDIPIEAFRKVMEWAQTLPKPPCCILQGHGEPLVHPHYLEMFGSAASACSEGIEFQTNGMLLFPQVTDALLDLAGPRWKRVKFSIDGPIEEIYREMRPGADFISLLRNVGHLAKQPNRPAITVECVVTALNRAAIRAMPEFAVQLGADILQLSPLSPWDGVFDIVISNDAFRAAVADARELAPPGLAVQAPEDTSPSPVCAAEACAVPQGVLFVSVEGTVFPCCNIREPIGDLNTQTVQEVLEGERRKHWLAGMKDHPICSTCYTRRPTV